MQSFIEILRVNEVKSGVKDGRPWELQDCECILLDDEGKPESVGVLPVPKTLRGKVQPGRYVGTFGLRADLSNRRIVAVLTGLSPIPPDYFKLRVPVPPSNKPSGV